MSDAIRSTARLSSVLRALDAAIRSPIEDHPAMTRAEQTEEFSAMVKAGERVYRETMYDIGADMTNTYMGAMLWADLKLRRLRTWCENERR